MNEHASYYAAQWVDRHGTTVDVCGDATGISFKVFPGDRSDPDVPFGELPDLIAALLTGPHGEGMQQLGARYDAMFTPPDGELLSPQREVLWLASAFLHRLLEHEDYKRWDEQDCEDTDSILRSLINAAYAVRTALLGQPDCPVPAHNAPHPPRRSITPARAEALQAARDNAMDAIPGRLAALRTQATASRPEPILLSGCTCGGIGATGTHRPGCPWAPRNH